MQEIPYIAHALEIASLKPDLVRRRAGGLSNLGAGSPNLLAYSLLVPDDGGGGGYDFCLQWP